MAAMAHPPWQDTRFGNLSTRGSFGTTFYPGASHHTMRAAGAKAKEPTPLGGWSLKLQTPRKCAGPLPLPVGGTSRSLSSSHNDARYNRPLAETGLSPLAVTMRQGTVGSGPKGSATGLEWRCRNTSDFSPSRAGGAGAFFTSASEMRPAGMSRAHKSEVCMRGWFGYKEIARRLDHPALETDRQKLVSSCPDLKLLTDV
eukprot:TRINITY_DN27954_c0_g1_i1.p1 TRINITY_DN27954_c0_g1~~TRINITY_DN27954_c0_g1_i1.p1  ORF type:complete len:200 (+),score=29.30 TRINITY_DN27954_c0_g1_i1:93-692(+)